MKFLAIHSSSVFSVPFDSVVPTPSPFGPTFGCPSSKAPAFPVVVNYSGFGLKVLLLPVTLLAFVASIFAQTSPAKVVSSDASTNKPRIVCEEATFDFGSKDSNEVVEHTFILKNTGIADLVITAVRPACGCTAAALARSTIPPGESTELSTKLSLSGRNGQVQKPIAVESNDPANPALQLVMKGTVANEFTVTPSILTLRQTAPEEHAAGSVMISSNGNPFQITKAEAFPLSIKVRADPMPDGLSYQIFAVFKKITESDPVPCLITLQTDNPRQPTLEIPTTVVLQKKIIVAPERIILRHGDAISKKYVVLKSADGTALAIKDILTPDTSVKVDYTSTASSIRLAIRGLDAQRDFDGKKITVDLRNGETLQIPISLESFK